MKTVSNIDATIVAQAPKLAPYIETMRKNIADAFVLVECTKPHRKGSLGRGLGTALVLFVCLR